MQRWQLFVVLALVCAVAPAGAIRQYCYPDEAQILCDLAPTAPNPIVGGNANAPCVVNSAVSLATGNYTGANCGNDPIFQQPTVYVVEGGDLTVPAGSEVGLGLNMVLCGNGRFSVQRATLRLLAAYPFQFSTYALDDSAIEYEDVTLFTVDYGLEVAGALFQSHFGRSTLQCRRSTTASCLGSGRPGALDVWELGVVANATAALDSRNGFSEYYVAGEAKFQIVNNAEHNMFIEACPAWPLRLSFPRVCRPPCSLPADGVSQLFAPPTTPWTLNVTTSLTTAWIVASYATNNVTIYDTGADSLAAISLRELGQQQQHYRLLLQGGTPPVLQGLEPSRILRFDNATVAASFTVWPDAANTYVEVLPGSAPVGDLLPSPLANQTIAARNVSLVAGMVQSVANSSILLDACLGIDLPIRTFPDGFFRMRDSSLVNALYVRGPTYLFNSRYDVAQLGWEGGQLYELNASASWDPAATYPPDAVLAVELLGLAARSDATVTIQPFPTGTAVLLDSAGALIAQLAAWDQPVAATGAPLLLVNGTAAGINVTRCQDCEIRLLWDAEPRAYYSFRVDIAAEKERPSSNDGGPRGATMAMAIMALPVAVVAVGAV